MANAYFPEISAEQNLNLQLIFKHHKHVEFQFVLNCPYCNSPKSLLIMITRDHFFCFRCKMYSTIERLAVDSEKKLYDHREPKWNKMQQKITVPKKEGV